MEHLVIVTGGSSGLGRALIDTAPAGSTRVDVSRSGHGGPEVRHVRADLTDPVSWAEVGAVMEDLVSATDWDRITLIHSAGTLTPIGYVGETDSDAVTANVLLNSASGQVLGHRFLAAVRGLTCRRELVMVSSGAARHAVAGWATYGAAKAAIGQWVGAVGQEQADRGGAMVLSVAPGTLATPMQEQIRATDPSDFPRVQQFRERYEAGELADPDEIAGRLWKVLDDARLETGGAVNLRDLA